jgi:hypothetical protein
LDNKSKHIKDWDKFLDTDGIKSNLIRASLYLFSYELLKNTIVDKIKDFYVQGFDGTKDIIGENYTSKVLNRKIDGKQNIFLSSLYWLEESGAITKDDITEISAIREFRNTVAHQIDKILADSDFNIDEKKERQIFEFIKKIERWWIREVEIPTNPDFDGKDIPDDEIMSGKEIFYSYIKNITDDLLKK